ncbi:hypothetical protein B551_0211690 [Cupriavidus sp. HPC(L)]|nr:hypothetical protein B551_0211690 [Cupriavidus sp. HPC(L)]
MAGQSLVLNVPVKRARAIAERDDEVRVIRVSGKGGRAVNARQRVVVEPHGKAVRASSRASAKASVKASVKASTGASSGRASAKASAAPKAKAKGKAR